ncbi:MAG: SPOR domain-containing protein, partial [Pseudomonadota bacterium]
ALAGNPERGVFVLTNALRAGQNSAKIRQNLAYTYALAGNWRAARVMVAEDVPADKVDARLSEWATNARPEDHMTRVSKLLGIAPMGDNGMPAMLALSNFPSTEEMVAEAEAAMPTDAAPAQIAKAPGTASQAETLAFGSAVKDNKVEAAEPGPKASAMPTPAPSAAPVVATVETAPRRSTKTVQPAAPRFVSNPVTQALPETAAPTRVAQAPAKAPKPAAPSVAPAPKGDTHMVQLGSYVSQEEAKRGWATLKGKFPQLAAHDVVITKAEVKGKTYYRVAAAGFGRQGAAQMCSTVRSAGRGCFAYSKANPPKGAVDKGTRIAAAR